MKGTGPSVLPRSAGWLLAALAVVASSASGTRVSPLDDLREAAAARGDAIGLGIPPSTPEKAALGRALERLDLPRASLLDDLRVLVPVVRTLEGAFPGDPGLGTAMDDCLAVLVQEIHGERPTLLEWTVRALTERDRRRLEGAVRRLSEDEARYGSVADREERARLLLRSCRTVERTRRRVRLAAPVMDPPRFEGVAPDFSLPDVNPASATAGLSVSPRDYLGNVTAIFFMAST